MLKNPYPGKFIVFEGLDGSGQTTQSRLLRDYLVQKGYKVVLTKEPTKTSKVSSKIQKFLVQKEKISSKKLQELFAKDRKEHLKKVIIPALKKGKIVISDRYFFSSFAYGKASGVAFKYLFQINKNFLMPDLTFILKVPPKICLKRIIKRGAKLTPFEEKEKLTKVWRFYEKIVKMFKKKTLIFIIDGQKSKKMVFSLVKKIIEKHL